MNIWKSNGTTNNISICVYFFPFVGGKLSKYKIGKGDKNKEKQQQQKQHQLQDFG